MDILIRSILCLCILNGLSTLISYGQTVPDLTGHWSGVANVSKDVDIAQEYYIEQKGALLSGYSVGWVLQGKDSAKVNFSGTVTAQSVKIRETGFVYHVGTRCLSNLSLTYSKTGDQERLVGNWYGDWSMKTCPPGVSGKLELVKVKPKPVLQASIPYDDVSRAVETSSTDYYGQVLVDNLRKRKYYALIIGIDDYNDDEIQNLDNPILDAKSIYKVLTNRYTFSVENTTLLLNPSRDGIIEAFDDLSLKIIDKDQLLIFYAGHGVWDERMKQGYWLPSDANIVSKSRWLSNSTIRDYIGGIQSKHTLLITDACFSGGIFKERGVKVANSKAMLQLYKLPSRKAMTSGTLTTVPDKSVFMQYLIKNLERNDETLISTESLFNGFKIAVINNSANGQVPQYGTIGQVGDEGGDFIFLKR